MDEERKWTWKDKLGLAFMLWFLFAFLGALAGCTLTTTEKTTRTEVTTEPPAKDEIKAAVETLLGERFITLKRVETELQIEIIANTNGAPTLNHIQANKDIIDVMKEIGTRIPEGTTRVTFNFYEGTQKIVIVDIYPEAYAHDWSATLSQNVPDIAGYYWKK